MKKLIVSLAAVRLLAGPLSSISQAGIVCDVQEKLGVTNIKECEDNLP